MAKNKKQEITFAKEKLLSMERYSGRRDLLAALLEDDSMYTLGEIDTLINKFMKGTVK